MPSLASVHLRATEQCATCHLYREDFMDEQAPAISGHTFEPNFKGCVASGCHSTQFEIETRAAAFMASIDQRVADIKTRLGDESTWQYSATGGPSDQSTISDNVKKIRFLISYIESDGSSGIHNPDYVKSMLDKAEELLDDEGL
ncbi:MAG: ammonia-forming cytochrome c nitrite reductase subunit c552 [Planctomycetota bacterium]|nr:MAG: ammonia-forming cytochrome c nitrite reductase subunit c552 [Planctomycetota bacterium]